jgi:hypothetical protein
VPPSCMRSAASNLPVMRFPVGEHRAYDSVQAVWERSGSLHPARAAAHTTYINASSGACGEQRCAMFHVRNNSSAVYFFKASNITT